MSKHDNFPVKLNDGRRFEVTANELKVLLDQNAVEIIPNGGARAVFVALGQHYVGQMHGDETAQGLASFSEHPAAPKDREWFERQNIDIRDFYIKGRRDAFAGNVDVIGSLDESDEEDAAYFRGVNSVPEERRGETAPRPVADRPQA